MGARRLIHKGEARVTREEAQLIRLVLISAAWAAGEVLVVASGLRGLGTILPAGLAAGAYAVTEGLGRPRLGGGDPKYWRGRRIDDDRGGRLS